LRNRGTGLGTINIRHSVGSFSLSQEMGKNCRTKLKTLAEKRASARKKGGKETGRPLGPNAKKEGPLEKKLRTH